MSGFELWRPSPTDRTGDDDTIRYPGASVTARPSQARLARPTWRLPQRHYRSIKAGAANRLSIVRIFQDRYASIRLPCLDTYRTRARRAGIRTILWEPRTMLVP